MTITDRMMTVRELCEYLNVPKWTVYSWVFKRKIPVISISKRCVRFRKSEVDAWIKSKSRPAGPEPVRQEPERRKGRPRAVGYDIDVIVDEAKKEAIGG